ncbi:taste receptor type 2 member 39-like [Rana temporaria]|uniref:taste receptor type 2 member 39-like n=1 Tax=Rana temporaria TaxID=8407 RepID=UPI001AAC60FB|nr:taste receptor type 2 member 39-like [Rana temporaria]
MNPEGYSQNDLPYISIIILELSTGVFMYLFVIYVIYRDSIKTKALSSSDKILLCLGISNMFYVFLMLVGLLDYFCSLGIFSMIHTTYLYLYLLLFTMSSCGWLSASLGFFYFIKISNFESGFFSWMKNNISSVFPWLLLGDLLVSLFNSALSSLFFIFSPALSHNNTGSFVSIVSIFSQSRTTFIYSAMANSVGPFLVLFITTLYSVVSLMKHSYRMKKGVQTPSNENLRSFNKVVWRMMNFLLFYGIYYIVMVIFFFTIITKMESGFWLSYLLISLFPIVQAVLLVLANPRLKAAWKDMFSCLHLRKMSTCM